MKEPLADSSDWVSAFSLKSLSARKKNQIEHRKRKGKKIEIHEEFTEKQLQETWGEYGKILKKKGQKIVASILETDTPRVDGHQIKVEMPNETMKKELEKEQEPLMSFIREKIQNTDVSLLITVNKKAEKKYAFTPKEKYEKLREKNPLLDKLKEVFDLEV